MTRVRVKYEVLLFLYAYLRKIDLSLDRSRWTSWRKLQEYYEGYVDPMIIVDYLKVKFDLPDTEFQNLPFFPKKSSSVKKLSSAFTKRYYLNQDEILYCCYLIVAFNDALLSDAEAYSEEFEKLRVDIANFYTTVLESLLFNKDLNILMRIEHFNQSENLIVVKLSEFFPSDIKI